MPAQAEALGSNAQAAHAAATLANLILKTREGVGKKTQSTKEKVVSMERVLSSAKWRRGGLYILSLTGPEDSIIFPDHRINGLVPIRRTYG
jgi:hypothetical protein